MATQPQLVSNADLRRSSRLTEIACPECGAPAEITDRFVFGGSGGRVEHAKTCCQAGHWLTPLAEDVEALSK